MSLYTHPRPGPPGGCLLAVLIVAAIGLVATWIVKEGRDRDE